MKNACVLLVVGVIGCHKQPATTIEAAPFASNEVTPFASIEAKAAADAVLAKRGEYIAAIAGFGVPEIKSR